MITCKAIKAAAFAHHEIVLLVMASSPTVSKLGDKVGDNENRGTETPSFPCFFE